MKLQLLTAAASAVLMAVPSLAFANDQGWYVRGNVGYGVVTDMDFTGDLAGDVQGEGNAAISLGVGYEFGNNWRLELDASQLWNDLGAISQAGNTSAGMRLTSGMLNAIYDFSDFGSWEPYIGAGVGLTRASLSARAASSPSGFLFPPANAPINSAVCPGNNLCTFNQPDTAIAWQLLAGLGYKITDNLTWDTQYRYLNVGGLDYRGLGQDLQVPIGLGVLNNGSEIPTAVSGAGSHTLMTGLRYRFGAKAPAPTPPPPVQEYVKCKDGSQALTMADCPTVMTRTYVCWNETEVTDTKMCPPKSVAPLPPTFTCPDGSLVYDQRTCPVIAPVASICDIGAPNFVVYFPWDQAALTDQARAVILNATNLANQCSVSGIVIEGHADSSGAASYNVGLSHRRADNVEGELRRNGLTTSNVTKTARGETALAVRTDDGVREPGNRRTEVIIRLIPTTNFTR